MKILPYCLLLIEDVQFPRNCTDNCSIYCIAYDMASGKRIRILISSVCPIPRRRRHIAEKQSVQELNHM